MKKTLLAAALAIATLGATAHPLPQTHYHENGRVVIGNEIKPEVDVRYETDRRGRQVKVTTTTTCIDDRVNRRNNHIRCLHERTTIEREIVRRDEPEIEDRIVRRYIERDDNGRRWIVTVIDRCVDPRYNRRGQEYCADWDRVVERERVRRAPRSPSLDLDGDGRTNSWERLLFRSFREALDNNN